MKRRRMRLACGAALLAVLFAWIVPLGESPDELAHIRYCESLAKGRVPPPWGGDGAGYEGHQPPLGYLLPALVLAVSGGLDLAPTANPGLDFRTPGNRAFLPPFADAGDRLVLRLSRMTQALWAALAVWAGLALAHDRPGALAFLLAPQLLFICGTVNNDAALIALVTVALLQLTRVAATGEHAALAGVLVSAALFTKASAFLLLLPVVVAAALSPAERSSTRSRYSPRLMLMGVVAAGLVGWSLFHLARFGTLQPPLLTASHVASVRELLVEPRWIGGLFRSFWAKFGWLNTPLPWPFYIWFAGLSAAVLAGARRVRGPERLILASAVVANLVLLVVYLLTVDLQAQGRYLSPTAAALAAFGTAAIPARLQAVVACIALLVALASLATIAMAFH